MHAHTFFELKKNNDSYKIVSFWQGFEKRFVASSMEFALFFYGFSVQLFWLFSGSIIQ